MVVETTRVFVKLKQVKAMVSAGGAKFDHMQWSYTMIRSSETNYLDKKSKTGQKEQSHVWLLSTGPKDEGCCMGEHEVLQGARRRGFPHTFFYKFMKNKQLFVFPLQFMWISQVAVQLVYNL